MNKEQIFVSSIGNLLKAIKKVDKSLVDEDYSSKLYPFNENLDVVIKDIEAWYKDECNKMNPILSKKESDRLYFQNNKVKVMKRRRENYKKNVINKNVIKEI